MSELATMAAAMIATGVASGVIAGLLGVGGGIVMVPVLDLVLGMLDVPLDVRMHVAVATSLAVIIPTSVASARAHYIRDAMDIELVKRWALYIVVGALLGIVVASRVDGTVLSLVFGGLALAVAIKMALPLDDKVVANDVPTTPITGVIPLSIGAMSSMIGIGGGTMTVPALTLMNTPIHRAVATSAVFGLFISVPGAIGMIVAGWDNQQLPSGNLGYVSLLGFVLIAPTSVMAAPLGARLAHATSKRLLSASFAIFLVLVSARMLSRAF